MNRLNDTPAQPAADSTDTTAGLLSSLRVCVDTVAAALAAACTSSEGPPSSLDAKALDREQGAAFELAWAKAELEAADAAVNATGLTPLQRRLAHAFAADALPRALTHVQNIWLDLGREGAGVQALVSSPRLAQLRQDAGSSHALAQLGQDVAASTTGALTFAAADEEIAMARDAFERFAVEQVNPIAQRIHAQDLTVPESLLQPLREMGVFGLSIPEQFGGSATGQTRDQALMVAVTEVLSEASLAAAGSLITRPEILARALLAGGTPEQQAHWLPRLASGELLCAISITEPDFGSDVAGLRLSATRVPGGWRLRGAKSWCTFAGKAQVLMVVARTREDRQLGHRGLSLFLVEKPSTDAHEFHCQSPGGGTLEGRATPTIGYRGMHSYDLSFDDFFVPEDHLIGGAAGEGQGFYYTMNGMTGGRLQTAGRACGVMRAAIRATLAQSADRRVFGRALVDYPLTRIKIARMAARWLACRALAERVALSSDGPTHSMEASLAKLLACRSAELVTRESLQVHGAMGYAEETPASRHFVDARVLSIFEGAEETLALKVIARGLLDRAARTMAATTPETAP